MPPQQNIVAIPHLFTDMTRIEIKRPRFWVLNMGGWIAYGVLIYLTHLPTAAREGYLLKLLFVKGVRTGIGFCLSLVMRLIYKQGLSRSSSFVQIGVTTLVCSVTCGCLWLALYTLLGWVLDPVAFSLKPWVQYPREALDYSYVLLGWSALYFGIEYWVNLQQQQQDALKASALANQAQLEMLRYQLNPHFLFNALNSVRASIDENPITAKRLITEFSEFLRYSLLSKNSMNATLTDEIEAIRNYLAVEKIRFEDRLEVDFDIDEDAGDFQLPSFLIHPLVENAIKHGMLSAHSPLRVRISAHAHDGCLRIEIANTGSISDRPGRARSNGAGVGLKNVRERLSYGGGHNFFNLIQDGEWVRAVIEVNHEKQFAGDSYR